MYILHTITMVNTPGVSLQQLLSIAKYWHYNTIQGYYSTLQDSVIHNTLWSRVILKDTE